MASLGLAVAATPTSRLRQAVIHCDRWWNPAREEQATARVHRLGQDAVVQGFRLITRTTQEEKIHNLIMKKCTLATSFVQEDDAGTINNRFHA